MKLDCTKLVALACPLALLGACTVGPDYVRPAVETPAAFKERDWKQAQPRDREDRGKWWEVFNDPLLNSLQEQVDISNQNLAKAEAQFRQAPRWCGSARAAYYPNVTGGVSTTRSRASSTTIAQPSATPVSRGVVTNHNLPFQATWEADVWGSIGRTVEANAAGAQASAADLEAARLSAQAALAQNYFQLRALDAQQQLLEDTVAAYGKSLQLTQNPLRGGRRGQGRCRAGADPVEDHAGAGRSISACSARSSSTPSRCWWASRRRSFSIPRAAAQRGAAAGSAGPALGAARTPPGHRGRGAPHGRGERADRRRQGRLFPGRSRCPPAPGSRARPWLTGSRCRAASGRSAPPSPSRLFDGGLRQAATDQAIAAYDANVAAYRQTVLTGFQEVEDNLAALRILEQEAQVQDEAVKSARQSVELTTNQYKAGIVTYLNVIAVQAAALGNERASIDILNRRLAATVLLVKALGGGWNQSLLPSNDALLGRSSGDRTR